MKQVTTQAKNSNISLIIGDKNFLENKSGITFNKFSIIGEGKAVLAFSKDKNLKSLEEIKSENIKKITIPHPKKVIYGIATMQIFHNSNLFFDISQKLLVVATVPQVSTYLITNEVDAGIINLTSALANKHKLAGYFIIDKSLYEPIEIVAASTKTCDNSCYEFINFLQSANAKEILKKYGL